MGSPHSKNVRRLLRLFPQDFRDQFGEEIVEHLRLEALELRCASRMTHRTWFMAVAWELAFAAFTHRLRMLSLPRIVTCVAAGASGLVVAATTAAAVFIVFEHTVRFPLLELAGTTRAPTLNLGGLVAVILFLLALHVRLSQRPGKWNNSAD